MRWIVVLLTVFAFVGAADAMEVGIEFRYHPDETGQRTVNQSIEAEQDDGEYEAEIDEPEGERKITLTAEAFKAMVGLVEQALREFKIEAGQEIEGAYVEVMLEFQGEDREIEITLIYPAGKVPEAYVKLQERYFKTVHR